MAFWYHSDRSTALKDRQAESIALFQRYFKDTFGLDLYPHFGSLLGIVRNGDFIEWDHDFDMAFLSSKHTAKEVQQELVEVLEVLRDNGMLIKYWRRPIRQGGRTVQIEEFIKTDHQIADPEGQAYIWVRDVYIDLYIDWIDQEGKYHTCTVDVLGMEQEFFPTLTDGSLRGRDILIPRNADVMLERIYGDWQTPNSNKVRGQGMTALRVAPFLITHQL